MEIELEKRRIEELDILKGIGIVLMVLDHCMAWGEDVFIHSLIQSFHMPLFFFSSGFLLKKRSVKETMMSKTKSVLLPHVYFATFYACVFILFFLLGKRGGIETLKSVESLYFFSTESEFTVFASPIWFLQALFIVEILFSIINNRFQSFDFLLIATIGIIGITWSRSMRCTLPFAIEPALTGIVFFYAGYKIRDNLKMYMHKEELYKYVSIPVCMSIIWIILVSMNGCIDMRSCRYYNPVLYLVNGLLGTGVCFYLARIIKEKNLKIKRILIFVSNNSITYLTTHYFFVIYLGVFAEKILGTVGLVEKVVVFMGTWIVCTLLNYLIINYIPWIVGKQRKNNII